MLKFEEIGVLKEFGKVNREMPPDLF